MDASFQQPVEIREDGVNCDINIGGTGLTIIWVMVVFAMAIVGTRLYTQARITKQFGLSDYLMLCSIAVITGFASLISVQYQYGWGRHQSCITSLQELETQIKYNVAGQSFGIMGSTFGRLSFIVFMLALFGSKKWVWWSLWAMFLAQIVTNVGTVIVIYAQCKDPRALYTFTLPQDLCWPSYVQTYLGWAHTSFNGLCDLLLSILPATMVWKLNMTRRLKIGLTILLGMSAIGLVGLIMKCVYLDALSYEGDYSYNTVPMFTWITVEGTLVAVAASAPLLRPLIKHLRRRGRTQTASGYDLPQYANRSGQSDSTYNKFSSRVRTSVKGGGAIVGSPRTAYPLESESDEDFLVRHGQRAADAPEIAGPRNGGILVKQEYAVTSEQAKKEGWEKGENAGDIGEPQEGRPGERRPSSSAPSDTGIEEPSVPRSVWLRRGPVN